MKTKTDARKKSSRGVYECFHCRKNAVVWDGDSDGMDCEENPVIIQELHCNNCGAEICYVIPIDPPKESEGEP